MGIAINKVSSNGSWVEPDNKGRIAKGALVFNDYVGATEKKIIACAFARIFQIPFELIYTD